METEWICLDWVLRHHRRHLHHRRFLLRHRLNTTDPCPMILDQIRIHRRHRQDRDTMRHHRHHSHRVVTTIMVTIITMEVEEVHQCRDHQPIPIIWVLAVVVHHLPE